MTSTGTSTVSSIAAQQKFSALRKRLDHLGYKQPLGLESLPLVERLFADLIHTTESLKKSKLQLSDSSKDVSSVDSHIEPYKSDNAKLVKENNDLHRQLIKVTEESQVTIRELKNNLRKFEHESADLKFLNNQYVHKIRALETESTDKTNRILQLQEKNFHAVVQTPGGRKKNIPFRRQRMEIDSVVPPANITITQPAPLTSDPYIADLLKIADDKVSELTEKERIRTEEKEGLEGRIRHLSNQVETRDTEIDRLSRLLEGGRPYDVVALESRNRSNERLISHLNIQIDYLQQKNHDLQLQMDKAMDKASLATQTSLQTGLKNSELSEELQTVDYMAKQLQLDKDTVVRTADMKINDANIELHKARDELENIDLQNAQLKAESERLRADCIDLKSRLSSEQSNKEILDDLLHRCQDDKHKLGKRINKLLANEKELVLEIDRLKHRTSCGTNKKKNTKTPNRMESLLKSVEQERDYWKAEVEVYQKMSASRSPARGRSPVRNTARSSTRSPIRGLNKSPSRLRNSSPLRASLDKSDIHQYESTISLLQSERDYYRNQYEQSLQTLRTSPTRLSKMDNSSTDEELSRVMRERDELQIMLDKFERHMSEIQSNVKVLTSERDKINILYEETKDELCRLRRDVVRSPKSPKTSLAAQAVLRRVENERDDSLNELRRTTTERDSLRERLKIATETQVAERLRLEQRIEELELIATTAERERTEQQSHTDVVYSRVEDVENQLKHQQVESNVAKDEAQQQKATANQMRLLAEQAERALQDCQFRLNHKESELRGAEEKVVLLEQRIGEMNQSNQSERNISTRLKSTVSELDREKDSLQMCVDEKTEKIVMLEKEITQKDLTITELRSTIADIEASLLRAQDLLVSKDHEIINLRQQVDGMSSNLNDVTHTKETVLRENRRIQDDLGNMTRENQNVNRELQESLEEREKLKIQIQHYITEVKNTEELLAAKDIERNDILEQYRALSMEAEKFETLNHQLEGEGSNLRLELMTRENESRRLRERIELLERDLKEIMQSERSHELQVSSLNKTVSSLEESLRSCDNDKHGLMQDLSAVRDLCTQLEATKDSLQRQLTQATMDKEKLECMVEDGRRESDVLRSQMNTERASLKSLEQLLSSEREREFHTQLSSQEQAAEIQILRERLAMNDSKAELQSKDLSTAQSQIMELEGELERIKRQLTNERFERERAAHELRRHGLSFEATTSRLSNNHSILSTSLRSRSRSPGHRSPIRSPLSDLQPSSM